MRLAKTGGGEVRTIELDQERAPLIRLAFALYATGNYTLQSLAEELTDRGLTTRPGRYTGGPVSDSKLSSMLGDVYYLGYVRYADPHTGETELIKGRHEPLVDEATFERVQAIQESRRTAGERQRRHHHYLKGSLWCGWCQDKGIENRMRFTRARGKGGLYDYFYCRGREDDSCDLPYLPVEHVDEAVAKEVGRTRLEADVIARIEQAIADTLADDHDATRVRHAQLHAQLAKLDKQEENLLDLASEGTVATAKIRERLHSIARQRERVQAALLPTVADLSAAADYLRDAMRLLNNLGQLYRNAPDKHRRDLNQFVFEKLYVYDDDVTGTLREPFAEFAAVSNPAYNQSKPAQRRPRRSTDLTPVNRSMTGLAAAVALGKGSGKTVWWS